VFVPPLPLAMDHPGQDIPDAPCHNEREQRILGHAVAHGSLALANIPLGLWVLFSCLTGVLLTSFVHIPGGFSSTSGDIVERLAYLIQNVLGRALLWFALLVI
jgi:hypothetical protein